MSTCSHTDQLARLQPPKLSQSVHREECTQCFDSQDTAAGIDVCLSCFNGGCLDPGRHHARTHVRSSRHPFTLNVRRKVKPSAQRAGADAPPAKMTKLAIVADREEDTYEHVTFVKCWLCDSQNGAEIPDALRDPKVKALVDGVMQSLSSARQSEVKSWEEELLPCEHTLTIQQLATEPISASGLAHCASCDLKENLWLCLTCGSLGCGRQQFGGVGGNGHGLQHFETTGHGVSVKLGTITPEGGADIYCYLCNEERVDPDLPRHLAAFGINIQTQTKTEKSLTELQIEQNLKFDFSLTGEDGKALEPVSGPGLTGLANLGNSCYMASVLQTVFSLPAFQQRYLDGAATHAETCTVPLPAECVECQMHKVADGLLSGRYAHPAQYAVAQQEASGSAPVFQAGLRPAGFKALIGRGHAEFATMRQQDSEEFFAHLLQVVRRDAHTRGGGAPDPTSIFSFGMEQRLQCGTCAKVRYRVDETDVVSVTVPAIVSGKDADGKTTYAEVPLWQCLDGLLAPEALDYACPSCSRNVSAVKQSRFASFPDVLVVHAKKFQLVNWVPAKLDIPLILPPDDVLEFGTVHLGHGLLPDETALPDDSNAAALPPLDTSALAQLEGMGFPAIRCEKALRATGNSNAEAAMEWLFAHMDDPDIDDPIAPATSTGAPEPPAEQVAMLADMGFTAAQARKALRETGGNAERAVEWLFNHPDDTGADAPAAAPATPAKLPGSTAVPARYALKAFISHRGPSVHSGHYVAHVRSAEGWVLFNDEKVVRADKESVDALKKLAYLYVFERV